MRALKTLLAFSFLWYLQAGTLWAQSSSARLQQALSEATTPEKKVQAFQALYFYYQYIHPDSALFYIREGQQYFNQNHSELGSASMTSLMGLFDMSQGRMDMARTRQKEALAVFERIQHKPGIASIHSSLGVLDGKQEKLADATTHFITAMRLYQQLNDTDGIATTNMRLGIVNERAELLDKALDYYNKALALATLKPDIKGADMAVLNNNIGIIYGRMGNMEKALTHFNAALEGSATPRQAGIRVMTLNNLGIVYQRTGNDKMALHYIDEALELTNKQNMTDEYARVIITRASIISKKDPQKALETLNDALQRMRPLHMPSLELDLREEMVDAYEKQGNYKDALSMLKRLRLLEDSLRNVEQAKVVMNLQSVHELENTNAQLQLAKEKNIAAKKVRNIIIAVAALLAAMFFIVLLQYRRVLRLHNKLKKREAELERSNNMKDKLFSIIGHDLRGPISNVPAMLQILDDDDTNPEEQKYLMTSLITHTRAATETLDKLLFWGQAQLKGVSLNQQLFDVHNTISNNLSLIHITASQKKISIASNVPENTRIMADPVHFDFVVRNLLSNAVKFTRIGGHIHIGAIVEQEPGFVTFFVQDNGVGISQERIATIFETFGSSTRGTANEKGTSIGLMLCKEYVQQNGGKILVSSEPGNGTTFSFTMKTA